MSETLSPQLGFTAVIKRGSTGWTAEFRIADALVGGWNHAVNLMLDHDGPHWPPAATDDAPVTWAPAWFGNAPPAGTNRPPIADAGPAGFYSVGQPRLVTLDGTASYDPDGDPLTFTWTQAGGPSVVLSNAASASPSFVANPAPTNQVLTFRLRVYDGTLRSAWSQTTVTLQPATLASRPGRAQAFLNDGALQMRFPAEAGASYILQASSNLVHWVSIQTNSADFLGLVDFLDRDIASRPMRFYRTLKH